jgi:hypothetical protein
MLVPFAAVLAAGLVLAATTRVADPERFGRGLGQLACFVLAASFGASWLFQTGRRAWAGVVAGTAAALVVAAAVAVLVLVARGAPAPGPPALTLEEAAPLVETEEGGVRWLRHPHLGFALRHPGPGFAALGEAEVAAALGPVVRQAGLHAYAWATEAPRDPAVLVVAISKGVGATREDLEAFVRGIARTMENEPGVRIVRRDTEWTDARRESNMEAVLPGASSFLRVRTLAVRLGPAARPWLVALVAFAPRRGGLDDVLLSFRER